MKKIHFKTAGFIFIIIVFMLITRSASQAEGLTDIGRGSIWKPDDKKIADMREECSKDVYPAFDDCLLEKMKEFGASAKALEFTQLLMKAEYPFCFMSAFREMGKVDAAEVSCPFMANTMGFTLLVNGDPRIFQPGNYEYLKNIDISKDPRYPAIIKKFPKAELWFKGNLITMNKAINGGQQFVWEHLIMNGCSACEVAGSAIITYDFDKTGKFIGVKLLKLNPAK